MFDDWETDDDFLKDFQEEEGREITTSTRSDTPSDSPALKKRKLNCPDNAKDTPTASNTKNHHILDLFTNKENQKVKPCNENSQQKEKDSIIKSLTVKSKDESVPILPKPLSLFESHEDVDFNAWDDSEFNFQNPEELRKKTGSSSVQGIKENSKTPDTRGSDHPKNIPEERNKELSCNAMEKKSTEETFNQSNDFQKPSSRVLDIHKESSGTPRIETTSIASEDQESASSKPGKDLGSIWKDIELELESKQSDFFSEVCDESAPERELGNLSRKTETIGLQKQVADKNVIPPTDGTSSKRDFILGVFNKKVDETSDKNQPGINKAEKVPKTIGVYADKITIEAQKANNLHPRSCDAPKPETSRLDSILKTFRKTKSESELDSTKVDGKSTPKKNIIFQRKFPGPAGLVPVEEANQSVSMVQDPEVKEETLNSSKIESFCISQRTKTRYSEGMWEFMMSELPTGFLSNFEIHEIKERAKVKSAGYVKVPYLAGIIDKLDYKYENSLIVLKDMTDSINGTLYLDLHSTYDNNILSVGSVVLLKDAGLIKSGTKHHPRVLITQKEIIGIYANKQQILRTKALRSIIAANENLRNRENGKSRDRSEGQTDSTREEPGIASDKISQTKVRSDINAMDRREKVPEILANSESEASTSSKKASNGTVHNFEVRNSSFCTKTRNLDLNDESRKSPPKEMTIAEKLSKLSKLRHEDVPSVEKSFEKEPVVEDFFNDDDDLLSQIEIGNFENLRENKKEEKAAVPNAPNNFFTLDDAFDEALSQMDVDFLS